MHSKDPVNNKTHLITYTNTDQIPGYAESDAKLILSNIFTAMPDNSMLQMPVWRSSLTSFTFPDKATGDYMMLTIYRGTTGYGSVHLHDLDNNITYSRSKYGGVWNDWSYGSTVKIAEKGFQNVAITNNGNAPYVTLSSFADMGIPDGAVITSIVCTGFGSATGIFNLVRSADGKSVMLLAPEGTFGYINVRVCYTL